MTAALCQAWQAVVGQGLVSRVWTHTASRYLQAPAEAKSVSALVSSFTTKEIGPDNL